MKFKKIWVLVVKSQTLVLWNNCMLYEYVLLSLV